MIFSPFLFVNTIFNNKNGIREQMTGKKKHCSPLSVQLFEKE